MFIGCVMHCVHTGVPRPVILLRSAQTGCKSGLIAGTRTEPSLARALTDPVVLMQLFLCFLLQLSEGAGVQVQG